jgi:hypothetical protein
VKRARRTKKTTRRSKDMVTLTNDVKASHERGRAAGGGAEAAVVVVVHQVMVVGGSIGITIDFDLAIATREVEGMNDLTRYADIYHHLVIA